MDIKNLLFAYPSVAVANFKYIFILFPCFSSTEYFSL